MIVIWLLVLYSLGRSLVTHTELYFAKYWQQIMIIKNILTEMQK